MLHVARSSYSTLHWTVTSSIRLLSKLNKPGQHGPASYCQMRCRTVNMAGNTVIKGGPKKIAFFRPTSYVNISETVYPIYLKIKVQRVPTSHSSHINFWVNRITRFRDIDVGSWPKKMTKKTKFFWPPFIYRFNILDFGTVLTIYLDDNSHNDITPWGTKSIFAHK